MSRILSRLPRLAAAVIVLPMLGGCINAASTARSGLAGVASIAGSRDAGAAGPLGKPLCAGLEIDGTCEATSFYSPHPASGITPAQPSADEKRCPPTVLGGPSVCTRF